MVTLCHRAGPQPAAQERAAQWLDLPGGGLPLQDALRQFDERQPGHGHPPLVAAGVHFIDLTGAQLLAQGALCRLQRSSALALIGEAAVLTLGDALIGMRRQRPEPWLDPARHTAPAAATAAPAMDDTDHALIALLRQDARTNVAALAAKLGVSRGTVTNRLRKLEDAHLIVGYTVRLRPDAEPDQIRAWMGVRVEGNQTRAVVASLLGEPGVAALHDTNGRWDLLAELRADNNAALSGVLERVRLIKGIANTETSILLATFR